LPFTPLITSRRKAAKRQRFVSRNAKSRDIAGDRDALAQRVIALVASELPAGVPTVLPVGVPTCGRRIRTAYKPKHEA
ncbi:MAG: hypothetical protein FWD31_15505, partial [Planctomycetaceae bacterium]|nr:hypothetical protein [Planctomycetaceae bacterium]